MAYILVTLLTSQKDMSPLNSDVIPVAPYENNQVISVILLTSISFKSASLPLSLISFSIKDLSSSLSLG